MKQVCTISGDREVGARLCTGFPALGPDLTLSTAQLAPVGVAPLKSAMQLQIAPFGLLCVTREKENVFLFPWFALQPVPRSGLVMGQAYSSPGLEVCSDSPIMADEGFLPFEAEGSTDMGKEISSCGQSWSRFTLLLITHITLYF